MCRSGARLCWCVAQDGRLDDECGVLTVSDLCPCVSVCSVMCVYGVGIGFVCVYVYSASLLTMGGSAARAGDFPVTACVSRRL